MLPDSMLLRMQLGHVQLGRVQLGRVHLFGPGRVQLGRVQLGRSSFDTCNFLDLDACNLDVCKVVEFGSGGPLSTVPQTVSWRIGDLYYRGGVPWLFLLFSYTEGWQP